VHLAISFLKLRLFLVKKERKKSFSTKNFDDWLHACRQPATRTVTHSLLWCVVAWEVNSLPRGPAQFFVKFTYRCAVGSAGRSHTRHCGLLTVPPVQRTFVCASVCDRVSDRVPRHGPHRHPSLPHTQLGLGDCCWPLSDAIGGNISTVSTVLLAPRRLAFVSG
jgi:hypothetical protein